MAIFVNDWPYVPTGKWTVRREVKEEETTAPFDVDDVAEGVTSHGADFILTLYDGDRSWWAPLYHLNAVHIEEVMWRLAENREHDLNVEKVDAEGEVAVSV